MMSIKEIVDEVIHKPEEDHRKAEDLLFQLTLEEFDILENCKDEKYQEACSRIKSSPLTLILGRRSVKVD